MDFSSDVNENFEGLLEVNREIFMPQMAEKTSPDAPPNCAAGPLVKRVRPRRSRPDPVFPEADGSQDFL